MSELHLDPECERALLELADALCQFERATGRGSTLTLRPDSSDERTLVFRNGKLMPPEFGTAKEILQTPVFGKSGF